MKDRFIVLPAFFLEDGLIYFHDLRINPFNIEAYYETSISFTDDNGKSVDDDAVKIFTKSGFEYEINLPIEIFEEFLS